MQKTSLRFASWLAGHLPQPLLQLIYRVPPLARLIRRTLNRAAPHGLTVVQVGGGLLAGMQVELDMQTEKDLWLGTYEPDLQAALRAFTPEGSVVYDVGANIGYVSLMCAYCTGPEGQVFSFEPLPQNQQRLECNLALNGLQQRVSLVKAAVGRQSGATKFWVHASTSMGRLDSVLPDKGSFSSAIDVQVVSLDDFVFVEGNPPPDLVKLDIEGGEVDALPGMQRVLQENRPLLLVEIHGTQAGRVVWQQLQQAGYSMYWMRRGHPPVVSQDELEGKAYIIARPQEAA